MRKSLVLALVLVLAVAGASFAADVSWGGKFEADGKWNSDFVPADEAKFFGQYELGSKLTLSLKAADEDGVWDVAADITDVGGDTKLGKYTVKLNDDAFKVTAWGKYGATAGIGDKSDELDLVVVSGKNTSEVPKIRVTTELGGFDLLTQVESKNLFVNGAADLSGFTLGATLDHKFADVDKAENRFAVYGSSEFSGVKVDGAFATRTGDDVDTEDNSAFGVKASADVTEQINVSGSYRSVGENFTGTETVSGYDLGAKYTEGLLQASLKYDVSTNDPKDSKDDTTKITVGATYRGSDENHAFADLFKADKYYENVAFAFGAKYTANDADDAPKSMIELDAAGPVVADQLWVKGNVTLAQNDAGFTRKFTPSYGTAGDVDDIKSYTGVTVDGYAAVGEKLALKPRVKSEQWTFVGPVDDSATSLLVQVEAKYALTADASLTAKLGQENLTRSINNVSTSAVNRFNSVGISVSF